MKKSISLIFVILFVFVLNTLAQDNVKIPISHSVYDDWKDLADPVISNNGEWISYEINPQLGDGILYLINTGNNKKYAIPRGYGARFSPGNDYVAFLIKPQYDTIREKKLEKQKDEDLPKDTLGILVYNTEEFLKIPRVNSFKIPEEESSWMVYKLEKEIIKDEKKKDEKKNKDIKKKTGDKSKGTGLVIYNPLSFSKIEYENVIEYVISKNGDLVSFVVSENDSVEFSRVFAAETKSESVSTVFEDEGISKKVVVDEMGEKIAFLFSDDTVKNKIFDLFFWDVGSEKARPVVDPDTEGVQEGWCVSENGRIYFSQDGSKLYFGTAPQAEPEAEDTLLEKEKVIIDIWHWQDKLLQPQQKVQLNNERKRSFLAVYHIEDNKMVQLADKKISNVNPILKGDGDIAFGTADKPYQKLISWESPGYRDVYTIDVKTGKKNLIIKKIQSRVSISPAGKYIVYYENSDSIWYVRDLASGKTAAVTKGLDVNFYDEIYDYPSDPNPYGLAGWTKDDEFVLLYDKYDIWKIDPTTKLAAENITSGYGRENKISFRYQRIDREMEFINPEEKILLTAFHEKTKADGFYKLDINSAGAPEKLIVEDCQFRFVQKAKNTDQVIWNKRSFQEYPDLWISDMDFRNPKKMSETNPQQDKYLWGTAELIKWVDFNGNETEGLIYKPENFDPSKKYPMMIYFYRRHSSTLHNHYEPKPGRSVIFPTLYTSNDYIVFMPDITYTDGYPGQSCYDAVISGTMSLINRGYVDKDRIGVQGQSWGGYQIAYLVTQTDIFACAMAGAPVTNMTSAYGGIRWASGMSRMMQYEESQSRIGGTLWEKPLHYIQNSPIFFAEKVNTPLLMRHDDEDGAVPWYQGIEYFVALRRLNKPVWMLNYNGSPHNLTLKRSNRMDFCIRMKQFFDHYLKDDKMPVWMKYGIPAIKKGKTLGYELIEEK